jgi:TetR/AcrR family transcriptional regulator, mexJK operon transcriptional repressor
MGTPRSPGRSAREARRGDGRCSTPPPGCSSPRGSRRRRCATWWRPPAGRAPPSTNCSATRPGLDHLAAARSPLPASPDEALVRFALHFLRGILNDETRAVVRVLVAESGRIPDIAEEFWQSGPATTVRGVADYLRALADGGGLRIEDPEASAQAFISMVVGELFMKGLILPDRPVPDDEIERRVRYAVRLFLDGIRAPAPAGGGPASGRS